MQRQQSKVRVAKANIVGFPIKTWCISTNIPLLPCPKALAKEDITRDLHHDKSELLIPYHMGQVQTCDDWTLSPKERITLLKVNDLLYM